jgi:3-deoxy-D-manno-octulosonate 8-phosphate phosphatase KdsC-like HAD superfamily phosphatase
MEGIQKVEIIISEVDGILNTGLHPVDELGNVPFKFFYNKDFEAINQLKKHFKVVFISCDNKINYNLFRSKNIPFYYEPKKKKPALMAALNRYTLSPDQALYLGSTYSDVECMRQIPLSLCTIDSVPDVKEIATMELPTYGGDGVMCTLYDMLRAEMRRRIAK